MTAAPKSYEEVELERDALLAALLHNYGPEGVKKILDNLEDAKNYVKTQRLITVTGISPEDIQLLDRLQRDNVCDGARPVVENSRGFEQAMRLSDKGYIALEQVALGVRLHITRLGMRVLKAIVNPPPSTPEETIAGRTLAQWKEDALRDDCLERMVPSDLRQLIGAIR